MKRNYNWRRATTLPYGNLLSCTPTHIGTYSLELECLNSSNNISFMETTTFSFRFSMPWSLQCHYNTVDNNDSNIFNSHH